MGQWTLANYRMIVYSSSRKLPLASRIDLNRALTFLSSQPLSEASNALPHHGIAIKCTSESLQKYYKVFVNVEQKSRVDQQ